MLPENIIYFTILTTAVGYFFYFKDTLYGQTRPNFVSWFLWMLVPFIGVFFQLKAGAGLSALPVFLAGFGPLLVILISLYRRNSIWKITRIDMFCGILAFLALVFYVITRDLGISILFAILSDGLAAIPTIIKSWKFPETETAVVYVPGIINNTLGLLIIKNWTFSIYSFSIYFIVINTIILFCLYRKKIFNFQ